MSESARPGRVAESSPPAGAASGGARPADGPDRPAARLGDLLLRAVGGVLAALGGFLTGALTMLLVPLRLRDAGWPAGLTDSSLRVPVAVVVAVCAAGFLVWFAGRATGWRWGPMLPAAGWFTAVVLALRSTSEGDRLLMPDDWVATLALFGGTMVLVIGIVVGLTSPRRST